MVRSHFCPLCLQRFTCDERDCYHPNIWYCGCMEEEIQKAEKKEEKR